MFHWILLTHPKTQADNVAGSVSQVRSPRIGETETLGQSFTAVQKLKGRDSDFLSGAPSTSKSQSTKKMPTDNPGAQGLVQEAHKKRAVSAELGQQLNQVTSEYFPTSQGNVPARTLYFGSACLPI